VTNDGEYTVKGGKNSNRKKAVARSRMLVAEVVCREPVDGRKWLIVATVHLHHQTAKKASGCAKAYDTWWGGFRHAMCRHPVDIVTGDFNMSLWEVSQKLLGYSSPVLAACFLWREGVGGGIMEEGCDDD
jgi:hypothetical protein